MTYSSLVCLSHTNMAVSLNGNALVLINVVALHQPRLEPGWVTNFIYRRVNHPTKSTQPSTLRGMVK